jgi:molybdenum cofactor cytidylyltransferase
LKGGVIAGVLLAAGESSRMGTTKALLPWLDTTLVDYQIAAMMRAGISTVVVVLGHDAGHIGAAISPVRDGVRIVINPAYREGRAGSVRTGIASLPPTVTDILIHSVDQPRSAGTLRSLVEAHLRGRHMITIPACGGHRGHPPIISASLRPDLVTLCEDQEGLRGLMRRHAAAITEVELRDPEVLVNLNTPADYRDALRMFQRAQ